MQIDPSYLDFIDNENLIDRLYKPTLNIISGFSDPIKSDAEKELLKIKKEILNRMDFLTEFRRFLKCK